MPSHYAIFHHWKHRLAEKCEPDDLILDGDDDDRKLRCVCFACGNPFGRHERAHITAHANGGSEDVANLHILCLSCHLESEHIGSEAAYWVWFNNIEFRSYGIWLEELTVKRSGTTSMAEFAQLCEAVLQEHDGDMASASAVMLKHMGYPYPGEAPRIRR